MTQHPDEAPWIKVLRDELRLAPMKSNFTFTRDEIMEILGMKIWQLPATGLKSALDRISLRRFLLLIRREYVSAFPLPEESWDLNREVAEHFNQEPPVSYAEYLAEHDKASLTGDYHTDGVLRVQAMLSRPELKIVCEMHMIATHFSVSIKEFAGQVLESPATLTFAVEQKANDQAS